MLYLNDLQTHLRVLKAWEATVAHTALLFCCWDRSCMHAAGCTGQRIAEVSKMGL